ADTSNPLNSFISFSSYWYLSGLSKCVKYLYAPLTLSNFTRCGALILSANFLAATLVTGPSHAKMTCQCAFLIVPSGFVSLSCSGDTANCKCVSANRSIQFSGADSGETTTPQALALILFAMIV